jgi:DNA mismatch endonuclease (patch repair protein)
MIDPKRSELMRKVRRESTGPELIVRKLLSEHGYRYRLNVKGLPGSPDIVFKGRRKVIFVHGCFWHRHSGCRLASMPKTRVEFWKDKFKANVTRDRRKEKQLRADDWEVLTVWQCQTKDTKALAKILNSFLQ